MDGSKGRVGKAVVGGALASRLGSRGRTAAGAGIAGTAFTALSHAPGRLAHLFRHRYPTVAITGMTGVGKSALADRLARRNAASTTSEVGSATMERRTRKNARLRGFRFRVVPGENAATRLGALDDVFHDEPVCGVLHVVAYGHATGRRTAGTTGTAAVDREQQLALELEDFAITAHRVASMAIRRKEPTWLVIAVTKTDLFADRVDEAVRYYSPGSDSPFARKLDELRALAGAAKLSVDVLPVSAAPESGVRLTKPNKPTKAPKQSKQEARDADALVAALETRMAQLSGHL